MASLTPLTQCARSAVQVRRIPSTIPILPQAQTAVFSSSSAIRPYSSMPTSLRRELAKMRDDVTKAREKESKGLLKPMDEIDVEGIEVELEPGENQEGLSASEMGQDGAFTKQVAQLQRWDGQALWRRSKRKKIEDMANDYLKDQAGNQAQLMRDARFNWWNDEEPDEDLVRYDPVEEDEFDEDDILSQSHLKLEEHREHREYMRLAAWELPLLGRLAKDYERPTAKQVLRFRHTTYMGEQHPAEKKVVVEFSPDDMPNLSDVQKMKLKKIAGVRYNPEKNIIKISCEAYENAAQNKRRLGTIVNKMVTEAKTGDNFADVPLDLRHHIFKKKKRFPHHWRISSERLQELDGIRKEAKLLEQTQKKSGTFVDGARIAADAAVKGPAVQYLATGSMHKADRRMAMPLRT